MKSKKPDAVVAILRNDDLVCAVSRKGNSTDLGLPGGKVEPGETPVEAVIRENKEEIGVLLIKPREVFQAMIGNRLVRCYEVERFEGNPHPVEPDTFVGWVKPIQLTTDECSFADYNASLFGIDRGQPSRVPEHQLLSGRLCQWCETPIERTCPRWCKIYDGKGSQT